VCVERESCGNDSYGDAVDVGREGWGERREVVMVVLVVILLVMVGFVKTIE
jgi:hypothetical protein